MASKRFELALLAVLLGGCAPSITIADGTSDGGEGGESAADGRGGKGGASLTGGSGGSGPQGGSGASGPQGGSGGSGPQGGSGGTVSGEGGAGLQGGTSGEGGATSCPGTVVQGQARLTLDDYCALFGGCPTTAEEAAGELGELCATPGTGIPVRVSEGCGVRLVSYDGGLAAAGYLYDSQSGELVGAYQYGDTLYGPCNTSSYYGGILPQGCADASQCNVCEGSGGLTCRFDCDCSEPTGPDPCFGPNSCECYCDRFCRSGGECGN